MSKKTCETSQDQSPRTSAASDDFGFKALTPDLAAEEACETSQDQSLITAAASSDFGFKVLTSDSPEQEDVRDLPGPWPQDCGCLERFRLQGADFGPA